MKKFLLFIVLFYVTQPISAQEIKNYLGDPQSQSPQIAEMMRHDAIPINMNNGSIDLSIDLIHLKDKDFDFPISVRYDSGGFKPGESDNYVGRNWALVCGGVITRQINGTPDDVASKKVGLDGLSVDGFLAVSKSKRNVIKLDDFKRNVFSNPYLYAKRRKGGQTENISVNLSTIASFNDRHIESFADLYEFSFGKYAGKFMLNFDGSVTSVTTSKGNCRVSLAKYNMVEGMYPYDSCIEITTEDDYVYTFGGSGYGPLEYTALSWMDSFQSTANTYNTNKHNITAYYLTKIKAPNGRELTIHYRDIESLYHKEVVQLSKDGFSDLLEKKVNLQYAMNGCSIVDVSGMNAINFAPTPVQRHWLVKLALIDYIETDNACIRFYYSERDMQPDYIDTSWDSFPKHCGPKLDSVVLCDQYRDQDQMAGSIETTRLSYEYHSGKRMFLKEVRNSREGNYAMNYKKVLNAPTPLATDIDHWGYWRGAGVGGTLIPTFENIEGDPTDYVLKSTDRQPTGKNVDATLLKEVVFPAGGKIAFEYEPHTFHQYLSVQNGAYIPRMKYPAGVHHGIAGGARVKNIQFYDRGNKLVKANVYEYVDISPLISGELMFMPYYRFARFTLNKNYGMEVKAFVWRSAGANYPTTASEYIRYPYVLERYIDIKNPSGGKAKGPYKITSFTSYATNPDDYPTDFGRDPYAFSTYQNGILKADACLTDDISKLYNANMGMKPSHDASHERGKVLSEKFYTSDGRLVRSIDYEYKRIPGDTVIHIYTLPLYESGGTGIYSHIGFEHFDRYKLSEKRMTDYDASGNYFGKTSIEQYAYDANNDLVEKKFVRGKADTLITTFAYPSGHQLPPNMNVYAATDNERKVIFTRNYDSRRIIKNVYRPTHAFSGDGKVNDTITQYLRYDDYGNLIHKVENGKYHTVYVWGYKGQHLIAKIENATYDQVHRALGETPESFSERSIPGIYMLDELRDKLPAAQVSTYSYRANVGMIFSTDPNGYKRAYSYDQSGRLVTISRISDKGASSILQVNQYNIVNQ